MFKLFTTAWVIAYLFHTVGGQRPSLWVAPGLLVALCLLLRPGSARLLVLFAILNVLEYLRLTPVASNHYLMAFFTDLSILLSAVYCALDNRRQQRPWWNIDADALFAFFSVAGRYFLLIMYFYGIYHKINQDFLDPAVSCASALWDAGLGRFGLAGATWGHYLAIWTTFVVEGLAIFFLFTPRWKYWGFAIGMPFHLFIGFTGYAYYMDFSTLCIALYVLFLPPQYVEKFNAAYNGLLQRLQLTPLQFGLLMLAALGLYYLVVRGIGWPRTFRDMPVFALYAIPFYLTFLLWCHRASFASIPTFFSTRGQPVTALLVLLFFLNGSAPYLGFKTESSINMFSNLYTEGGRSNHLVHAPLYLFDYQQRLVEVVQTDDPYLQRFMGRDRFLVEFEFARYLAHHPQTAVTYRVDGQILQHMAGTAYPRQYTWLEDKMLKFKPVDFQQPKACTH